jgi:type IV fimbrial biogenesis protein FimT
VVVVIIGVLAVIAIPSISERIGQMRNDRAAQEIAGIYRSARMRAMGRGSAVLVRYNAGALEVREAVMGGAAPAGCEPLPRPSCTPTGWVTVNPASDRNRVLTKFDVSQLGQYSNQGVHVDLSNPAGTAVTQMDVCFTRLGRTFVRYSIAEGTLFDTLVGVPEARVYRQPAGASAPVGPQRRIAILPNGAARVTL